MNDLAVVVGRGQHAVSAMAWRSLLEAIQPGMRSNYLVNEATMAIDAALSELTPFTLKRRNLGLRATKER